MGMREYKTVVGGPPREAALQVVYRRARELAMCHENSGALQGLYDLWLGHTCSGLIAVGSDRGTRAELARLEEDGVIVQQGGEYSLTELGLVVAGAVYARRLLQQPPGSR